MKQGKSSKSGLPAKMTLIHKGVVHEVAPEEKHHNGTRLVKLGQHVTVV